MNHMHLHKLLLPLFLSSQLSYADITPTPVEYYENTTNLFNNFSTHISIGTISGTANEYVYFPQENHTTSQLIWDIDSLQMLNVGFQLDFDIVKLNTDMSFALSDGDSYLVDYDWLVQGLDDWTDKSEHPDTIVTDAKIFDIYAEVDIYHINKDTTLTLLLGYRHESYTWEARGGSFIYSFDSFRDTSGTFKDGLLGITYEQTWSVPYVGMKIDSKINNITLHAQVRYSPFASGEMTDVHHLRNLTTVDTFDETTMTGVNVGLKYSLTPHYTLGVDYSYLNYKNSVGDSVWSENGQVDYLKNYAGADLKTSMLSVSLEYKF